MDINELLKSLTQQGEETPNYARVITELKTRRGLAEPDLAMAKMLDPKEHDVMDKTKRKDKDVKVDKTTAGVEKISVVEGTEETTTRKEPVARIALALQKLIVKRHVAFLFGNPVWLNAEAREEQEKTVLQAVKRALSDVKEKSLNRKVARQIFSCTEVAELWYPVMRDNNTYGFNSKYKLRCAVFSPLFGDNLYPYFDDSGDMIAFSREYVVEGPDKKKATYFETYTDKLFFKWVQGSSGYEIVEDYPKENAVGKIPVVYGKQGEVEWADVQNLIDRLEKLLSNFADTNDYHASPKIVVKGNLTGFAKKGEAGAVLQLEGDDASAQYLSWQNAPEAVKLEIETLLRMIYTITQTPDISFDAVKGLGAISGVALKLLFMDAHLKVQDHCEVFDEYLQRRINVIKAFIAQFEVKLKDAANKLQIEPEIIPYMIDDEKADIEKWVLANGNKPLVSQKRSAELAGLVKDTEEDYKTLQEESDRDKQFGFFEPTQA